MVIRSLVGLGYSDEIGILVQRIIYSSSHLNFRSKKEKGSSTEATEDKMV